MLCVDICNTIPSLAASSSTVIARQRCNAPQNSKQIWGLGQMHTHVQQLENWKWRKKVPGLKFDWLTRARGSRRYQILPFSLAERVFESVGYQLDFSVWLAERMSPFPILSIFIGWESFRNYFVWLAERMSRLHSLSIFIGWYRYFLFVRDSVQIKLDRLNKSLHPRGDIAEFGCGCSPGRTGHRCVDSKKILRACLMHWFNLEWVCKVSDSVLSYDLEPTEYLFA